MVERVAIPQRVERAARDAVARVRRRFGDRVRCATLFGSYARGDACGDSDIDLFLLIDGLTEADRGVVFELAAEASLEHLVRVQAFAPGPEEHAWLRRNECRIIRDVDAEGIPL